MQPAVLTGPATGPSTPMAGSPQSRVSAVDALRGLVMIIMALDHVREFFHVGAMSYQPEDLSRTTAILFFTRWVTHICAPVFMFTAGLGASFYLARTRSRGQLSHFLWTRGLWLVFLDLTVSRLALNFTLFQGILILNVLWALGWCMVALALLVHLPDRILAGLSLAVILLHNLLDPISATRFGGAAWLWQMLHQPGVFSAGGALVLVAYPLVPWIAVMAAGFCFGGIFRLEPVARQRWMTRLGLGLVLAFLLIRGVNVYGDPAPWSHDYPGMTLLSFLRTTKYPPSLDFLLMTLGPALLLLAWFDRLTWRRSNPLLVFGRVPLFYFIVHLYVAHTIAIPLALLRYGHAGFLFGPAPSMGGAPESYPAGYGYSLAAVYLIWLVVVVLLYPLSRAFGRLKERRRDWWLSYL